MFVKQVLLAIVKVMPTCRHHVSIRVLDEHQCMNIPTIYVYRVWVKSDTVHVNEF